MRLDHLEIVNFKNIAQTGLDFSPGVNALLGMNGMGKSNLLEAIHLLSMARGMSSAPESSMIKHGCDMMLTKGDYTLDSGASWTVSCGIVAGKGKTLKCNGKEYQRISQHIGRLPIVCVTPGDTNIITGSAEGRRRLVDMVLSQADESYLSALIRYNRALESRNKMLRAGVNDSILYESVELAMADAARMVHSKRHEWVNSINPDFVRYHNAITGDSEQATLAYRSQLEDTEFFDLINERRKRDLTLGYTSAGIHRDDLETRLDGFAIRHAGSQGQLKSYTIALRLAIFAFLKKHNGNTPILLLDDIFDRLDATRVRRIMQTVTQNSEFGQIFVTDTNRKHLDDIVRDASGDFTMLEVENGCFSNFSPNSQTDAKWNATNH